jgi:hypothetical protein
MTDSPAHILHSRERSGLRSLLVLHDHFHLLARTRRKSAQDLRHFRIEPVRRSHFPQAGGVLPEYDSGQQKYREA